MIQGKLTGLRALEKEDLPLLRNWRNLEDFRKNFREFRELNMVNQETWFSRMCSSEKDFMFGIVRQSDKTLIGAAGLIYVNWQIRAADISFYIGADEAYIDQKGIALDAAQTLVRYGFETLNLHKVWTELYEFDNRKIDFFTKSLGFTKDGSLRDNCFHEGKYWNSHIFSLLDSEYGKTNG